MTIDFKGETPALVRARTRRAIDEWCQRIAKKCALWLLGAWAFALLLDWALALTVPGQGWIQVGLLSCFLIAVLGTLSLLLIAPLALFWGSPLWRWLQPDTLRYGFAALIVIVPTWRIVRLILADTGPMRGVMDGEAAERKVSAILAKPWLRERGYVVLENLFLVGTGRRGAWSREIDHVLIGPAGVIVIETKSRRGAIRGKIDAQNWLHTREGGSESAMRNPLLQLKDHVRTVRQLIGDNTVPTHSLCVIAKAQVDPALHPSVTTPDGLMKMLRQLIDTAPRILSPARVTEMTHRLHAARSTNPTQWSEHLARARARAAENTPAQVRQHA